MVREFPILYRFDGTKLAELRNAQNISNPEKFGDIWELSFSYSKFLIDANGNLVLDDNYEPEFDLKTDMIQNEYLILFKDEWYIIKTITESRSDDGEMSLFVECKLKSIELSYKNIYYLNLNSPIRYPPTAEEAILETITYPFQIGVGTVIASSLSTITIKTNNLTTTDLIGKKVSIVEGVGVIQTREITNYNISSGLVTVSPNWSTTPNTSSRYRVHNSKYSLGTVDVSLNNKFRGFEFKEMTILEALLQIRDMYSGNLTYDFTLNGSQFDNSINLIEDSGSPTVEFRYGKNIKSVSRQIDMNVGGYTRVSPIGRKQLRITDVATSSRTDNSITYNEHTLGKGDIFNFQYYLAQGYTLEFCQENFVRDFSFVNDGYDDSQWLFDDAKSELEKLSLPKITYAMSIYDLSVLTGREYMSFKSGDRVRVVDNDLNISIDTTIFVKNTNFNTPENTTVELSNFNDNVGDFLTRITEANNKYTEERKLYGKANTIVVADELTSRDWRYADYVVPSDGTYTADEIIQKAIDDMDNGGEIVMVDGSYYLDKQLEIYGRDSIILSGNGDATILTPSKDLNFCIIVDTNSSNIAINKMKIKDNLYTTVDHYGFQNPIGVYNSTNVITTMVTFELIKANNIFISIDCLNVDFTNNTITYHSEFIYGGSDYISIDGVDMKRVENANITGNSFTGRFLIRCINITETSGTFVSTETLKGVFNINDNHFQLYSTDFIIAVGYDVVYAAPDIPQATQKTSSVSILNNVITQEAGREAIAFEVNSVIIVASVRDVLVANNSIDYYNAGAFCNCVRLIACYGGNINGNKININSREISGDNNRYIKAEGVQKINITNNTLSKYDEAYSMDVGIEIILNYTYGASIPPININSEYILISNNMLRDAYDTTAITFAGVPNVTSVNNII